MKKEIKCNLITDVENFPYDWENWDYSPELLRSVQYTTAVPDLAKDPDSEMVFDYDGLVEWFLSWRDEDEILFDMSPEEFVSYHIGRTLSPVRILSERSDD